MAFKFFKKKENEFPTEEKAEVLDNSLPELPSMPELPNFKEGFRSPEELKPQILRPHNMPGKLPPPQGLPGGIQPPGLPERIPSHELPENVPTELPPFKAPEPLPLPAPRPMGLEGRNTGYPSQNNTAPIKLKSSFGPLPVVRGAPHIYIRVDKYKDVMQVIQNLGRQIDSTKADLEKIHSISESEREKIKESASVLLEIERLLSYLEKTFSSPEE